MTLDWQTTLTPLLVILVPLLLSQGKRLLGAQTWLVPLIAPALAAALDYVSALATHTQVGSTKAMALGLMGVGLREAVDQLRKLAVQPMIPPPARKLLVLIALPAVLLAGCATGLPAQAGSYNPLAPLAAFAHEDLQAALDDATAHNDLVAADCYTVLLQIGTAGLIKPPAVKGAVSAFQAARDLVSGGGQGGLHAIAREINRGCAALFVDANATLLRLGLIAAPKP